MNNRKCLIVLSAAVMIAYGVVSAQSELYVEQTHNAEAFKAAIFGGELCNDANILGIISSGRSIKTYDVSAFKEKVSIDVLPMHMSACSFSTAGQNMFLGGADGNIYVLNSGSGEIKKMFSAHTGGVIGLRVNGAENVLYSAGTDHLLQTMDAVTGNIVKSWSASGDDITAFTVSSSNKLIAIGLSTGGIKIFNAQQLAPLLSWQDSKAGISALAYSADEKLLAAGTVNGVIYVWDIKSGVLKTTITQPAGIKALAFDPRTQWLAGASVDSALTFYDVTTSVVRKKIREENGYITYLSFVSNESVVTGTSQGMIQSWKVLAAPPDTTNPMITIEQPTMPSPKVYGTEYEIRGWAFDDSDIKIVTVNGIAVQLISRSAADTVRIPAGMKVAKHFTAKVKLDSVGINSFEVKATLTIIQLYGTEPFKDFQTMKP